MRARRDEQVAEGVFEVAAAEALAAYDKVIGLDFSDVAADGPLHKSPAGGEGTGKNPTDRGRLGRKWPVLTEKNGIPFGVATDGANRNYSAMLAPTLDDAKGKGLLQEIETIWLDRGYGSDATAQRLVERETVDALIAKKRKQGTTGGTKNNQPMGLRWPVERSGSWLSNFAQLRRGTDRKSGHRLVQLALAVVFLL
ncbi:MAG: transposase, partial [Acidimicrobiales bacterium]